MMPLKRSRAHQNTNRGVSLIIVLIMMIIIGITAATAMRSATSEQRATNNQRVEATAMQYAEAALRFCESQMILADSSRDSHLQEANLYHSDPSPPTGPTTTGWEDPLTWTSPTAGLSSASRVSVPAIYLQQNVADTVLPNKYPECIAERMTGGYGLVITARGFSPDYAADGSGFTTSGSVVWLQSAIN